MDKIAQQSVGVEIEHSTEAQVEICLSKLVSVNVASKAWKINKWSSFWNLPSRRAAIPLTLRKRADGQGIRRRFQKVQKNDSEPDNNENLMVTKKRV